MPASDVTVEVTVGEPKTIKVGSTTPINLVNGALKDSSSTDITGLSWSYFHNTLTMNGYEGSYIQEGSLKDITIKVVGNNNTLNVNNQEALFFTGDFKIEGGNKDYDHLIISATGTSSRATYYNMFIKNMTLKINATLSNNGNPNRAVHGDLTIDGANFEVIVNKTHSAAYYVAGVDGYLDLLNGGTANFEVTGETGTTRISTHQGAPWISKASKVVAQYTTGDGVSADNPFSMTVTVPSTVTKIKSQKGGLEEGESSILVGDSGTVTLYKEGNTTTSVDTITLSEGLTFYAKTQANKWFKITIGVATP